jgi:hypothetical protein
VWAGAAVHGRIVGLSQACVCEEAIMSGQDSDIQWYIARDGKQHGPLTDVEMRTFVAHSYLRASDLIWRPGMTEWQAAPAAFPDALPGAAQQPAQPVRASRGPAQAAPAYNGNGKAAAAGRHAQTSDFDAGHQPQQQQPVRSRARALALAAAAITVIGGGAFALATYHQPLIDMVSGSSEATTEDGQPPVVAAPEDTKVAQPDAPLPTPDDVATNTATPAPGSMQLGVGDNAPAAAPAPAAEPQPPAQQQPTTTSSVTASEANAGKDTQVAAIEPQSPTPPPAPSIDGSIIDARLQKVAVWGLIKHEYPDWYVTEVSAANQLVADKKSDNDVAMLLAQGLVNLRRQNADKALAASSEKLQNIAVAFLNHLKSLRAQSVSACFGFISKGETSPAVVQTMEHPETATALNAQVGAIFEAISEGGKSPVKHDAAVKSDYDMLIKELGKLGWKEEDLQVFSNPKLLAKREPEQVCKMVQDWFVAHLAVPDKSVRDRLLYETLKPVVSG